jgi:hypothetical protein
MMDGAWCVRYIKCAKMEILSTLASSTNCYEIVNELTEYARQAMHLTPEAAHSFSISWFGHAQLGHSSHDSEPHPQCCRDVVYPGIAREAVKAVGRIALNVSRWLTDSAHGTITSWCSAHLRLPELHACGVCMLQVPEVPGIVERLLVFLESNCEEVMAEALVQMKDLLRRYPDMAEVVVAQVRG